jgi:CxxC-x17-CxxC domain-containing protein
MSTDRTLVCSDCGNEFVFTASEQDFYSERGFTDPRRCRDCRAARKSQRGASGGDSRGGYSSGGGYASTSSYSNDYSGGYSSGGGGYSSGGGGYRDRAPREMYEATCSDCGNVARVPFRPTSGKPVYCADCFAKRRA